METENFLKLGATVIGIIGILLIGFGFMDPYALDGIALLGHDVTVLGTLVTLQAQEIIYGFVVLVLGFGAFVYTKMKYG